MRVNKFTYFSFSYIDAPFDCICSFLKKQKTNPLDHLSIGQYNCNHLLPQARWELPVPQIYNPDSYKALIYAYQSDKADGCVLLSNLQDGWQSLVYVITNGMNTSSFRFQFSALTSKEPMNYFSYRNAQTKDERIVYAMFEDKWLFYEQGQPLWFESLNDYKKRLIKSRITPALLEKYCEKIGLQIDDDCFLNTIHTSALYEHTW